MVEIRTQRLLLRPARADDLRAVNAILTDPRAMAYWSSLPHAGLEETREWLDRMIAIAPDEGEDFIIEHEGRAIGKAGLHRFPNIGYVLHPDYWGRGLATEALRAVIDRAFAVHALDWINADVDPRNDASMGLLKRLGFHETERKARTWLIGDQWYDSVYFRLDRSSWKSLIHSRG